MNTSYYGTNTTYGYNYGAVQAFGTGMLIFVGILWLIAIAVSILQIISMWKIYKKAGKPGWASIIPIYNMIVLFEIVGRKWWTLFLLMIPFYNIYLIIMINIELAKKFGKSSGFGIGLTFIPVIFYPILAFGKKNVFEGEESVASGGDTSVTSENTNLEGNVNMDSSIPNNQFPQNDFNNVTEQTNSINTQQGFVNTFENEPWPPVSGLNNGVTQSQNPDFTNNTIPTFTTNNQPVNFIIPNDSMQNLDNNNQFNDEVSSYQNQVNSDTINAVSEALSNMDNTQSENNVLFDSNKFDPQLGVEEVQQAPIQNDATEQPSVIQTPTMEEINAQPVQNNMAFNNVINEQQPAIQPSANEEINLQSSQDMFTNNVVSDKQPIVQTPVNDQINMQPVQSDVTLNDNVQQDIQTPVNEEIMDFGNENTNLDDVNQDQNNVSSGQM